LDAKNLIEALSFGLSGAGGDVVALGLDVVFISRVAESLDSFGERFEERLFTPAEIAYARSAPGQRAERLAARFAAKEAVIKALSLGDTGVDWRDIEVLRNTDGSCAIALHGRVAAALATRGADRVLVSLSHDGDYAAAVVAVLSDKVRDGCAQKSSA
jgi:holo-[acyl-carrier protein] synthase